MRDGRIEVAPDSVDRCACLGGSSSGALCEEPLRSADDRLGVALGVAVVIAIQLTNASSLAGFETALDTVAGRRRSKSSDRRRRRRTALPELGGCASSATSRRSSKAIVASCGSRRHPTEALQRPRHRHPARSPFREYSLLESASIRTRQRSRRHANLEICSSESRSIDPASAIIAARFASRSDSASDRHCLVMVGDRGRAADRPRPAQATRGRRGCSTATSC